MQLYTVGDFGKSVAKQLEYLSAQSVEKTEIQSHTILSEVFLEKEDYHIFIANIPLVKTAMELENLVFHYKKIFIPILIDFPYLTLGPVTKDGCQACFHCYIDRVLQHEPNAKLSKDLYEYYQLNQCAGPVGNHPADVNLVTYWIKNLIENEQKDRFVSNVIRVNLFNRSIISSKIIGVHGCERCGIKRNPKDRSFQQISQAIRAVIIK